MEGSLSIVDAHLHLWNPDKLSYPWLQNFAKLNRNFSIPEYHVETKEIEIAKMVFVQCECTPSQYLEEIQLVIHAAKDDARLRGIVCWFPLKSADATQLIIEELSDPLIKGIRCLEESPESLYWNPVFIRNVQMLSTFNLSFDLCVSAVQLPNAVALVEKCPTTSFILDHMGKPNAANVDFSQWRKNIIQLAKQPNVYCKISGIVPEADNKAWHKDQLKRYVDVAFEYFGFHRVIFGSDWPVVKLSSSFQEWYRTLSELSNGISLQDRYKLFYGNACRFYRI